jgi:hypothetical protein
MSNELYKEREFIVVTNDEEGIDGSIEANPSNLGKTEIATVELVDQRSGNVHATARVEVRTDGDERWYEPDSVLITGYGPNGEEIDLPLDVAQKLSDETGLEDHFTNLCREYDRDESQDDLDSL